MAYIELQHLCPTCPAENIFFDGKSMLLKFILKRWKYAKEQKKPKAEECMNVLSFNNPGQVSQGNVSNTHITRAEFQQVTPAWK